jgi:hypothetical protein
MLCPHCQTQLRGPCPACSRLIDLRWSVCPYCAVPVDRAAQELPPGIEGVRVLETPRAGRHERAVAAAAQRVGIDRDELDALTDALSSGERRAAVGAGAADGVAAGLSRRLSVFGEFPRIRSGAWSRFGLGDDAADDAQSESPDAMSAPPREATSFWADPLPAAERDAEKTP